MAVLLQTIRLYRTGHLIWISIVCLFPGLGFPVQNGLNFSTSCYHVYYKKYITQVAFTIFSIIYIYICMCVCVCVCVMEYTCIIYSYQSINLCNLKEQLNCTILISVYPVI